MLRVSAKRQDSDTELQRILRHTIACQICELWSLNGGTAYRVSQSADSVCVVSTNGRAAPEMSKTTARSYGKHQSLIVLCGHDTASSIVNETKSEQSSTQ